MKMMYQNVGIIMYVILTIIEDKLTLTNVAPDSFAMAFASMVLPVPGGPYCSNSIDQISWELLACTHHHHR